ncbi:SDR family NAD(P)-dependent oxidoreductase [Sphingobium lactosutens]|uniref:SDR family NAD(P)-dependent oxidoreductase n=1 Tax=Sphingobium lactosutens TaxID=522773 RepID=UPI00277B49BE|nr:SDR family NAD(P)-dependent oxidoreductase [Sphingobium lactosutens]
MVTGAASGIGRATVDLLAAAGASVAVTDIDGDRAISVARAIQDRGLNAAGWALDVSDNVSIPLSSAISLRISGASTCWSTMRGPLPPHLTLLIALGVAGTRREC